MDVGAAPPEANQARPPIPKPGQLCVPGFEISADDTVVDVGCGYDAPVCKYAGWLGADVIGVDVDAAQLECAVRMMEGVPARSFRGILSDSDPLPLPDGIATVVVATEVVEHVRNPQAFLAELVRIGAPGARYLISVPHPTSEEVMRQIAPPWYFREPFHINVFEPAVLDTLITEAGLEVEGRYENGFYWSMYWFLRMAIGMADPWEERPHHPSLDAWDQVAVELGKLAENPRGSQLTLHLDHLIPKSQVRLARKVECPSSSLANIPTDQRPSRLKRWVRDGGIQLGGYHFRWTLRRISADARE